MIPKSHISHVVRVLLALFALAGACYAQGEERTIEKLSWSFEPVEIMSIKAKGRDLEFGRSFHDEEDWLTGLTITAKNISDQSISSIELELIFPRAEGNDYVHFMHYGKDPSARDATLVRQVPPGETAEIKINPLNIAIIHDQLVGLGYSPKVQRAQIRVRSVTFTDGTMWSGDFILSPDPQNPHRKINPKRVEKPYPRKGPAQASVSSKRQEWASRRFNHLRFVANNILDAMAMTSRPNAPPFQTLQCDKDFLASTDLECNKIGPAPEDKDPCKYPFDALFTPNKVFTANARERTATVACAFRAWSSTCPAAGSPASPYAESSARRRYAHGDGRACLSLCARRRCKQDRQRLKRSGKSLSG